AAASAATRAQSVAETVSARSASLSPGTSNAEYVVNEIKRHKIAVALAVIVLIGSAVWFLDSRTRTNAGTAIKSIAVMPFANESGNADLEYLSDGMTETLMSSLSQIPSLNVKARSFVFRYKGREVNPQTVGRDLNVQAILNGHVVQRGSDLSLYLELVDA